MVDVLASTGCYNKISYNGCFKRQKFISHSFGPTGKSKVKVQTDLIPLSD